MTDYTKSTNFTSKDSLSTGNPLKIVKGSEFDIEFNAISTAIATKADLNSPTFIGTPLAPTAAAGTSSTQIATTAFLATLYPIGTVYTNISNSANPATLFGFGTWVAITGRVIVGLDSGDTSFDTAGETGGSKDAIVVSHTHTYSGNTSGQSASHTHNEQYGNVGGSGYMSASAGGGSVASGNSTGVNSNDHTHSYSGTTAATGSSATNANLPPYVVAYVWKRTA